MSREFANAARRQGRAKSIADIPAFRQHLERTGLTFDQWAARNGASLAPVDTVSPSLCAQYERVRLAR